MNRLIIDADGVFLSERPYWNAALATACHLHGLRFDPDAWDGLASACIDRLNLQRVTKSRGCNSNYDFAAVLARALAESHHRSAFETAVLAHHFDAAGAMLDESARALYEPDNRASGSADPLIAFGIARNEPFFEQIVETFIAVNRKVDTTGWPYPRVLLKESAEATSRAFQAAVDRGFEIWVCTSRDRDDLLEKIELLALGKWLDRSRAVTATDALEAEQAIGVAPLGKPHWFPAVCAATGYDDAVAMVSGQRSVAPEQCAIYAGDAPADFLAVSACNARDIPLPYIHVRSGVTGPKEEAEIAAAPFTRGIVNDLAGVISLLDGGPLMVGVVDYGAGNIGSVVNALRHLDCSSSVCSNADDVRASERIILPGVGHFGTALRHLHATGMFAAVRDAAASGTPLLGICLGLHLFFDAGEEGGDQPGLGLLPGRVTRMTAARLPHMGWNQVTFDRGGPLAATGDHEYYYFAHSYAANARDAGDVIARVEVDGHTLPAAVARDRVVGVQFHPEKSGGPGLALLGRFLAC